MRYGLNTVYETGLCEFHLLLALTLCVNFSSTGQVPANFYMTLFSIYGYYRMNEWMNETINQSINQSLNQSINQSINQSESVIYPCQLKELLRPLNIH